MVMCRAHGSYAEAMKKGDDGRPDFAARKACNYLEDAIEVNVAYLMDGDSRFGAKECFLETDFVTIFSRTAAAT